ncbi:hypothetical protein HDU76_001964, partial [Blyttiomyces sp. JEL0837]
MTDSQQQSPTISSLPRNILQRIVVHIKDTKTQIIMRQLSTNWRDVIDTTMFRHVSLSPKTIDTILNWGTAAAACSTITPSLQHSDSIDDQNMAPTPTEFGSTHGPNKGRSGILQNIHYVNDQFKDTTADERVKIYNALASMPNLKGVFHHQSSHLDRRSSNPRYAYKHQMTVYKALLEKKENITHLNISYALTSGVDLITNFSKKFLEHGSSLNLCVLNLTFRMTGFDGFDFGLLKNLVHVHTMSIDALGIENPSNPSTSFIEMLSSLPKLLQRLKVMAGPHYVLNCAGNFPLHTNNLPQLTSLKIFHFINSGNISLNNPNALLNILSERVTTIKDSLSWIMPNVTELKVRYGNEVQIFKKKDEPAPASTPPFLESIFEAFGWCAAASFFEGAYGSHVQLSSHFSKFHHHLCHIGFEYHRLVDMVLNVAETAGPTAELKSMSFRSVRWDIGSTEKYGKILQKYGGGLTELYLDDGFFTLDRIKKYWEVNNVDNPLQSLQSLALFGSDGSSTPVLNVSKALRNQLVDMLPTTVREIRVDNEIVSPPMLLNSFAEYAGRRGIQVQVGKFQHPLDVWSYPCSA